MSNAADMPRRLPRAERERQILDVAHSMFAAAGYAAVTMDEVAARVGVTKPLLYTYWGNKERLFAACLRSDAERLLDTVAATVGANPTPEGALQDGVRAFFAFLAVERGTFRVVFDETLPAGGLVAVGVAEYRQQITNVVASLLLAQFPPAARRKARVEVEALSHALLGATEALGRWWLRNDSSLSPEQTAELLITTVLPGLEARSTSKTQETA